MTDTPIPDTPPETPPVTDTPVPPTPPVTGTPASTPSVTTTPAITPSPVYYCHFFYLWGSGDPGDHVDYGYTDCDGFPVVGSADMTYAQSQGIDPIASFCGTSPYVIGNASWGMNSPC